MQMALAAECAFLTDYARARQGTAGIRVIDVLWSLPLLLQAPSELFVVQLCLASDGKLRSELKSDVPDYHKHPRFALVGTAVDSVMQRYDESFCRAVELQPLLESRERV